MSLIMVLSMSPHYVVAEPEPAPKKVLIDYCHGKDSSVYGSEVIDPLLFANLTEMGYEVIIAYGGLNDSMNLVFHIDQKTWVI